MTNSFKIWLNVVNAILIRDVKVRSGPYFSGYIFIFLMPFLHLFVVLIVFSLIGRVAPFGSDNIMYFGLSILPFVVFSYPSQQIMRSIAVNAPLLYFSRVKIFDIMIARGFLEIINGLLVSVLVLVILRLWSGEFQPERPVFLLYSLLCTLGFGFAFGSLNALIGQLFPTWTTALGVVYAVFWILSGVIFYPHSVPEPYFSYLQYNPLLVCIESIRFSYYLSYPNTLVRLDFVIFLSLFLVAIGLIFDRFGRRIIVNI